MFDDCVPSACVFAVCSLKRLRGYNADWILPTPELCLDADACSNEEMGQQGLQQQYHQQQQQRNGEGGQNIPIVGQSSLQQIPRLQQTQIVPAPAVADGAVETGEGNETSERLHVTGEANHQQQEKKAGSYVNGGNPPQWPDEGSALADDNINRQLRCLQTNQLIQAGQQLSSSAAQASSTGRSKMTMPVGKSRGVSELHHVGKPGVAPAGKDHGRDQSQQSQQPEQQRQQTQQQHQYQQQRVQASDDAHMPGNGEGHAVAQQRQQRPRHGALPAGQPRRPLDLLQQQLRRWGEMGNRALPSPQAGPNDRKAHSLSSRLQADTVRVIGEGPGLNHSVGQRQGWQMSTDALHHQALPSISQRIQQQPMLDSRPATHLSTLTNRQQEDTQHDPAPHIAALAGHKVHGRGIAQENQRQLLSDSAPTSHQFSLAPATWLSPLAGLQQDPVLHSAALSGFGIQGGLSARRRNYAGLLKDITTHYDDTQVSEQREQCSSLASECAWAQSSVPVSQGAWTQDPEGHAHML